MRRFHWMLLTPVILVTACGDQDGTTADMSGGTPPDSDAVYTATGMVLESPEHGPQLCLGGVEESYPPQCGGPEIAGWSWDDVDGYESAQGVTWGPYSVTGTYDGSTFTLTEPPSPPEDVADDEPDFSTPCAEPSGGWAVVDPGKTTDATLNEALERAAAEPDYAGAWVDQSINPASDAESDLETEQAMNDPAKLVLNVRFTGDLTRHETELREVWGGALCVSEAEHTEAELRAIQEELSDTPGFLSSGVDIIAGEVTLGVIVDDGLQERLDEQYGTGVVRVQAALRPAGS